MGFGEVLGFADAIAQFIPCGSDSGLVLVVAFPRPEDWKRSGTSGLVQTEYGRLHRHLLVGPVIIFHPHMIVMENVANHLVSLEVRNPRRPIRLVNNLDEGRMYQPNNGQGASGRTLNRSSFQSMFTLNDEKGGSSNEECQDGSLAGRWEIEIKPGQFM